MFFLRALGLLYARGCVAVQPPLLLASMRAVCGVTTDDTRAHGILMERSQAFDAGFGQPA